MFLFPKNTIFFPSLNIQNKNLKKYYFIYNENLIYIKINHNENFNKLLIFYKFIKI
jgi:hypothetical protein